MPSQIRTLSLCLSIGSLMACGSSASSTTVPDSLTLIGVDPTDFPKFNAALANRPAGAGAPNAGAPNAGSAGSANAGAPGANETSAGSAGISNDNAPSAGQTGGGSAPTADALGGDGGTSGNAGTRGDGGVANANTLDATTSSTASDPGACRLGLGAYVAELIDVSGLLVKDTGPDLPRSLTVQVSPATACDHAVALSAAVPNRQYVMRVKIYADRDGDPNTLDVCTIAGTDVTVPKVGGSCPATLTEASSIVQPIATATCYAWRENEAQSTTFIAAGAAGMAGAGGATGNSEDAGTAGYRQTRCDDATRGCPGLAIQYRTITLRYCVDTTSR